MPVYLVYVLSTNAMKLVHLYNAEMLGTATFKEVHGYWLVVVAIIHLYLTSNRPVFLFFLL